MNLSKMALDFLFLFDAAGGPTQHNPAVYLAAMFLAFLLIALMMMTVGSIIDGLRIKASRVVEHLDRVPTRRVAPMTRHAL